MFATPEEDLQAFMGVTGTDADTAKRYLAKAKGKADEAVAIFFQEMDGSAGGDAATAAAAPGGEEDEASDVEDEDTSGVARHESVDAILGKAKDGSKKDEGAKAKSKWDGLAGGVRLGGPAEAPPAAAAPAEDAASPGGSKPGKVCTVHIWFFSDGFTVEEAPKDEEKEAEKPAAKPPARKTGMATLNDYEKPSKGGGKGKLAKMPKLPPLRAYDTPENEEFLAALKGGFVPKELRKVDEATKEPIGVSIAVTDFRPEAYPHELAEMQKKLQAEQAAESGSSSSAAAGPSSSLFQGSGQTLGGPASAGASSAAAGAAAPAGGAGADPELMQVIKAAPAPVVDESKPATTLQVRLSTGARVKARLNLDHTVADLWRLVAAEMGQAAFAAASGHALSAGFPPKPLTDFKATIQEKDLANSSVTHRCS